MKTNLSSVISSLTLASPVVLALGLAFAADGQQPPQACIQFDGERGHDVLIPQSPDFSVSPRGLTVSAWVRPDSFLFSESEPVTSDCRYVHWLGKGSGGRQEWTFRMYREDAHGCGTPPTRSKRTSFYVFNPQGGQGVGSYFEDELLLEEWIHVVGVIDAVGKTTTIYKNGVFRDLDSYCPMITPQGGDAPLRLGTREGGSYFQGALAELRIWNRPLRDIEVRDLYVSSVVPVEGLVAEYLLNEGQGTEVHDTVGGHADGMVRGATWCPMSSPINTTMKKGRAGK